MHESLLNRIFHVVGVASLVACAGRSIGDDEAADADESGSGISSESDSESGSESDSESESDTSEDADAPTPDMNRGGDGDPACEGLIDGSDDWVPPIQCLPMDAWPGWNAVCFPPPDGVACENEPFPDHCIVAKYSCGLAQIGEEIGCGPMLADSGDCCYVVWGECPIGRPWMVDGEARRSARVESGAWARALELDVSELDASTRAALADAWASEGLSEHASVASFARFTKQLLALAAPRALISSSIRAAHDEIRHAEACFALASAYAGTSIGPGPLDIRGGLAGPHDLASIAVSLAAEGCVAETVSAMLVAKARDRARAPVVRALLAEIAREEIEHVVFAWEALAWMCRRARAQGDDACLQRIAAVFGAAEQHVGFGAITPLAGNPARMRAHGYLAIAERREVAQRAIAELVAPAARRLFAALDKPVGTACEPELSRT